MFGKQKKETAESGTPERRRSPLLRETRRINELMHRGMLGGQKQYIPSPDAPVQEAGFAYRILGFTGNVAELDFEHLCSAFRVRAIQCVDDWTTGDEEEKELSELRYWVLEGALASVIRERGWERREIKARVLPPFDPDWEKVNNAPPVQYAPGAFEDVQRLFENDRLGYNTKLLREQKNEAVEIIESWFPPENWTPEESWREAALDPYAVLKVPKGAGLERVGKSYQKLINAVFRQLRRSEDVRESERLRRIYDSAYDKIELLNRRQKAAGRSPGMK